MRSKSHILPAAAAFALTIGVTIGTTGSAWAQPGPGHHNDGPPQNVLYVSSLTATGGTTPAPSVAGGPSSSLGRQPFTAQGCATAAYKTIGAAVTAAQAGETIIICPGVYKEDVVVPAGKPLTLEGVGNPLVDAQGLDNGVQVLASGSTVEGLTVAYATGEGVLVGSFAPQGTVLTVSNVVIKGNRVIHNDLGNPTGAVLTNAAYAECNGATNEPGDCGEGIHLLSADNSTVTGNTIYGNSGGILVTDESGPADGNTIAMNNISGNVLDCGITLAGHQAGTNNGGTWSPVAPTAGGVFNNVVRGNRSTDNGVIGQGAGILMATAAPGGAVYNNVVEGNYVAGNGLAGVTVHSHSAGENLNGNVVRANVIGLNNVDGDPDFGNNTPPAIDPSTTGVIVAVATGTGINPVSITVVGNWVVDDFYGLWETPGVTATTTAPANQFLGVNTPIFTAA